ncbi:hypothetical protein KHM83_04085 [Fusibacter paucivorans]|uniref:Uncharacterized protein n=1 Tax=Fusibacter paucivorans TaxID=76009 RepID=A0ABS5PL18_9FIRM|nr:hypothetical protein [Fusibacter paucivorans]MBS7525854.1 hypothetical protein [Fusibacter paucivorans]
MFLAVIVIALVSMMLYHRGYSAEKIIPIAILSGIVAYFIPLGAMIAWPFKLISGALGFAGGALGAVAGGVGGLVGGILSIIAGALSLVLGVIGGIIGLVFSIVGLVFGIIIAILVPLAIIWLIFKIVL